MSIIVLTIICWDSPCTVRKIMHNQVIVNTLRSANLAIMQILARIMQVVPKPIPKLRRREFGRDSIVTWFASVRSYQGPIRLGIERRIEIGIRIPEIIGRKRYVIWWSSGNPLRALRWKWNLDLMLGLVENEEKLLPMDIRRAPSRTGVLCRVSFSTSWGSTTWSVLRKPLISWSKPISVVFWDFQ